MTLPEDPKPEQGYIPKPPGKADLDEVSRDQALITDEWADAEPPASDPPA